MVSRRALLISGSLVAACSSPATASLIENAPPVGEVLESPWPSAIQPPVSATPAAQPPQHSNWKAFLMSGERSLSLERGGSGVQRVRYMRRDGTVDPEGYGIICYLMRDVRAERMTAIDPDLLDVLCGVQRWLAHHGRASVLRITSGFRTRETNSTTEGAAKNSMHLQGRAVDLVIPGVQPSVLGAMAREFNEGGGTGIYLSKGFVHVDTGSSRVWVRR